MDKTTAPKISGAKLLWIDEFRLLAHVFGVFQNEYASHPGRWSAEARAQLDAALAPDWPGLASKGGDRIQAEVAAKVATAFAFRSTAKDVRFSQGDAASIGPALERLASNFPEIFKKTLNKAMASASESFGCLARREVDEAALPTLMRMIELAPVEELRRLASRVFPSWQLKSPSATFKNGKNCVALYQGFFARGCRLEDVFPCSRTPGKSLAQALKEKIEQCGRGELRDFFMSQWELVSLESQGAASAWEAKGLEPKAQERMLSLVSALEEAYPGEGAPRAIAWLEAHPALEALREAAPSPERKAPKSL